MSDDTYDFWESKLAGNDPDPLSDRTKLPLGFFRTQHNFPLAVWLTDGGDRLALRGFAPGKLMATNAMERMAEMGNFGKAVREEVYRAAFDKGSWEDDPPPLTADRLPMSPSSYGLGHNLANADDPLEAMRRELDDEVETTDEFLRQPITTQEQADRAGTWARRVGMLAKRADDARKEEKEPHLLAGKSVDEKWKPIVIGATELTQKLKKHLEPFLLAQRRAAEEKRRQDILEADRLRREAEKHDDEETRGALVDDARRLERAAVEPVKTTAGRHGMRVGLRSGLEAIITDYDKAYAALKNHPSMREFVQTLADRACRAKMPLDGVEFRDSERVV